MTNIGLSLTKITILVWLVWLFGHDSHANYRSKYTSLTACQLSDIDDNHTQTFDCPTAMTDYGVALLSNDLRTSLRVNHGNKELIYSPLMSHYVGDKIEWRYTTIKTNKQYHALIYRLYINDNPTHHHHRSYLMVMRLKGDASCYLGMIPASKHANDQARKLADDPKATCQEH